MIYLDNSATTVPDQSVLDTFNKVSKSFFGNPSSLHNLGGTSEKLYGKIRTQAASLLNVNFDEIIFTSGGTEGNNLALTGIVGAYKQRGNHIITTEIEHASVYETCKRLEVKGFAVTYLKVDSDGLIDIEELKSALTDQTILVSIMHVNNEIGSVQPIKEIGDLLKEYPKAYFHVDAVQSFGKIPLNINENSIDLLTISGHKIHGLKGTGLLYLKKSVQLVPLFSGGGQELGYRSGTENLAGQAGLVRAMRLAMEKEESKNNLLRLKAQIITSLEKRRDIFINTPKLSAPHIVHFSIMGIKPETIIHALAEHNVYVSTQSACSSKSEDLSRVLLACGHDEERSRTGIRVSMSYYTTENEVNKFIHVLHSEIDKIREMLR